MSRAGADPALAAPRGVAAVGIEPLAAELDRQGVAVQRVTWRPPPPVAADALRRLAASTDAIDRANDVAVQRLQEARPLLVGVSTAGAAVPGMTRRTLLHAGPPVEWREMAGPLRGAIVGAALYEGLASSPDDAARRVQRGDLELGSCHDRGAVGPMAGVTSFSMPVWVVEDDVHGNRSFATLNEGLGRVLRYGAFDDEALGRLGWMAQVLAPILSDTLRRLAAPIDVWALVAQALQMGDECHNRNRAATSLLLRELLPGLLSAPAASAQLVDVAAFIAGNDHFFLNLGMAGAKAAADAAVGVAHATIVTTMARNGTTFGLRTSGTGPRWFIGPASEVEGLYLPGYGPDDASRDIGDSAITETVGLGGFALAAAPAIVRFVGGDAADALAATERMYPITWSESRHFQIPVLGFRGSPLGIDCREVAHTGVLPIITTGIAHRDPGVGQIGAGIVRPPMEAFSAAVRALAADAPGW